MNVISHKWTFFVKSPNEDFSNNLHKERFLSRGDLKEEYNDYNSRENYAPAASQDTIRICLEFSAGNGLIIECVDAYLCEDLDVPIYMYPPTYSNGIQTHPGKVFRL